MFRGVSSMYQGHPSIFLKRPPMRIPGMPTDGSDGALWSQGAAATAWRRLPAAPPTSPRRRSPGAPRRGVGGVEELGVRWARSDLTMCWKGLGDSGRHPFVGWISQV